MVNVMVYGLRLFHYMTPIQIFAPGQEAQQMRTGHGYTETT